MTHAGAKHDKTERRHSQTNEYRELHREKRESATNKGKKLGSSGKDKACAAKPGEHGRAGRDYGVSTR